MWEDLTALAIFTSCYFHFVIDDTLMVTWCAGIVQYWVFRLMSQEIQSDSVFNKITNNISGNISIPVTPNMAEFSDPNESEIPKKQKDNLLCKENAKELNLGVMVYDCW